jgi:hypothetical protein
LTLDAIEPNTRWTRAPTSSFSAAIFASATAAAVTGTVMPA